jgi:hypothetical protein
VRVVAVWAGCRCVLFGMKAGLAQSFHSLGGVEKLVEAFGCINSLTGALKVSEWRDHGQGRHGPPAPPPPSPSFPLCVTAAVPLGVKLMGPVAALRVVCRSPWWSWWLLLF